MREDETVKPRFVEAKVLSTLSLSEMAKPVDFPTSEQIVRKVASIKTKLKIQKEI